MARKSLWLKKLFHFISAEEFVQKSTQRKIICALGEKDASLVCTKRKSSLALLIVIKKLAKMIQMCLTERGAGAESRCSSLCTY